MPAPHFRLRCRICNQPVDWPPTELRCPRPSCRGPLQPRNTLPFDPGLIEPTLPGMWRFRHLLPPIPDNPITLGEGHTPLLAEKVDNRVLYLKNESLNPTGSYKDRGAALLINLRGQATVVMDDSSGNAGAALAAYAARARVEARIYVPARAPKAKKNQILRYGAHLIAVPGTRTDVTVAAEAAATEPGVFYASHVWHPGYALALQTIAWEIWEQLGGRAPDWVVVPVGNGTLLRGLRWGFRSLQKGRCIRELPRLVAVQAANCAPLFALSRDAYHPQTFRARRTIADGVAVPKPPLLEAVWAAVRKTKGCVLAVPEAEIRPAQEALARRGFFVEPTAALSFAALPQLEPLLQPDDTVVLILTGHGFKSS
ncbi:MAG: pyridoxal-phosphate dependent enzyme [Anaerolineae bacterium]|nr:pyridoxal-phosphate dependent enzyme [Anaerolineae bacterium]